MRRAMKVRIDDRWTLEKLEDEYYKLPYIVLRDEHSYSRVVTRETDSFLYNFLEAIYEEFLED